MRSPAQAAGTLQGAKAPVITAVLLAVATLVGGCGLGPGDLGRPRQNFLDTAIDRASPVTTLAERERRHRLRHFRRTPASLLFHAPNARLNALRDAIEIDRMLLAPLRAVQRETHETQRVRTVALRQFPALTDETRGLAGEAMAQDRAMEAELCPLLAFRAQHYRASLENAVALAPELEAVAAERSLLALEGAVADVCGLRRAATGLPLMVISK